MQIGLSVFLFISFLLSQGCYRGSGQTEIRSNRSQKSQESQDIGVKYEILTKNCFSEPRCFAFVFIDKRVMNARNLLLAVQEFERMNERREYLRVIFFDDLQVAKAYAEGKRVHDINFDAKAVYFREADQKYLKVKCFEADGGKFSEWANILDK